MKITMATGNVRSPRNGIMTTDISHVVENVSSSSIQRLAVKPQRLKRKGYKPIFGTLMEEIKRKKYQVILLK